MSFVSILKTIGKDLIIGEQAAAPFIGMLIPAAAAPLALINQLVIKAENTYQGEKQGATKLQVVQDEFTALLPMVQEILKEAGGINVEMSGDAITALINASVAQMNAAKALHDSFKVTKVT